MEPPVLLGHRQSLYHNVHTSCYIHANIGSKLARAFKNLGGNTDPNNVIEDSSFRDDDFNLHEVEDDEVRKYVNKIKTHKASGHNYVNARVLKDILLLIIPQLACMFNNSISSGIFPDKWAIGTIVPIPKTGDLSNMSIWRPITLLLAISKIMERMVHKQQMFYMLANDKLSEHQYGFRPGRSTADAVLELTSYIYGSINSKKLSSCLFIDMRKAFDTIHHGRLLHKLGSLGINTMSLRWFKSYLGNRKHSTVANNVCSSELSVSYGVPQGSILGPLLFSVYINNLPNIPQNSKLLLYADDAVLVTDGGSSRDIGLIAQPDLQNIVDWGNTNRLYINSEKKVGHIWLNCND